MFSQGMEKKKKRNEEGDAGVELIFFPSLLFFLLLLLLAAAAAAIAISSLSFFPTVAHWKQKEIATQKANIFPLDESNSFVDLEVKFLVCMSANPRTWSDASF